MSDHEPSSIFASIAKGGAFAVVLVAIFVIFFFVCCFGCLLSIDPDDLRELTEDLDEISDELDEINDRNRAARRERRNR